MHLPIIFGVLFSFLRFTQAFINIHPSYVNVSDSYYVPISDDIAKQFQVKNKQVVLQGSSLKNQSISTTTTSSFSTPSSTVSIQTETMTAGMTYLYSDDDSEAFQINITLNAKDYPVLIDTGSPYLWLYSSNCTDDSCLNKELFSTTGATNVNGTFALTYDSGVASGSIYEDEIIIAGFQVKDFEFGVANNVPALFKDYSFSGVLGLPADNASTTGLVNAVSFLSEEGDINSSKFTICIGEYDSDSENSGLLFLGSTKNSLYTGEIYTSPIIEEAISHWEFKIDSVYVDDYQISFNQLEINDELTNISRIGLLDSGTTSLVLSVADAERIHSFFYNAITDGQNYAILCNSTLNFEFEISGKNWTLTPEMYIGSTYPTNGDLNGYCVSNIQGFDSTNDGAWILGILFMMNKYVEFDYENQWIGLAERNNDIKFVNPPSNSASTLPIQTTFTSIASVITSTTSSSSVSLITKNITQNANDAQNIRPFSSSRWSLSFLLLIIFSYAY